MRELDKSHGRGKRLLVYLCGMWKRLQRDKEKGIQIMPDVREESTIEAIARAFTSNGRKQEQAMVDVGYTPAYANSYCGKMWENPRLRAAIARIDDKTVARTEYDIDACDKEYSQIIALAIQLNQPSAAVSAITGRARLRGWDKDTHVTTEQPTDLTPAEEEVYREMAQARIRAKIKITEAV